MSPKVFSSDSRDSPAHAARVLALSDRLRRDGRPLLASPVTGMTRILFLGAAPSDTVRMCLGKEVQAITARLRESEGGRNCQLIQEWAVRPHDLQALLLRHQPHIVHFSGHGSKAGELVLEDDQGAATTVPIFALQGLFSILGKRVRCVVLNACYSRPQAEAIAMHVEHVVGMRATISDEAAIAFASSFYLGLGYGEDVQTAFDLGRNQIEFTRMDQANVPVLLSRDQRGSETAAAGPAEASLPTTGTEPFAPTGDLRPGAAVREQSRTALSLDRTAQWARLESLCRRDQSVYFLLHGYREQEVRFLLDRIRRHIADETRHHLVVDLPYRVERSYPMTAAQWASRLRDGLAEALGRGGPAGPDSPAAVGTAETFLYDATLHQAVFLLIELQPDEPFRQAHQTALRQFLLEWLPGWLRSGARPHPLRVLVAVDHDRAETVRRPALVDSWMLEAVDQGIRYEPLEEMTFPGRAEVVAYLQRERVEGEWLREGVPAFDRIMEGYDRMVATGDTRFTKLVAFIDAALYPMSRP